MALVRLSAVSHEVIKCRVILNKLEPSRLYYCYLSNSVKKGKSSRSIQKFSSNWIGSYAAKGHSFNPNISSKLRVLRADVNIRNATERWPSVTKAWSTTAVRCLSTFNSRHLFQVPEDADQKRHSCTITTSRNFCSKKSGDDTVGSGDGNGNGAASGNGSSNDDSDNEPPQPLIQTMTLPATMTVPEVWPYVPVVAINRNPVFPKFIKIVEVMVFMLNSICGHSFEYYDNSY